MMSEDRAPPNLPDRLERLTGTPAGCCVAEYRRLAVRIRDSPRFPSTMRLAKALADEHRLLAASLLRHRGELCACEIQAATGLTHSTVSHHMAVLVEAGVVRARRKGKWMYYRLAPRAGVAIP